MSKHRPDQPYKVGYGKPPVNTRWRQGQSGNLRGRSPGTKNLATDLKEELAERIPIREGPRELKLSKQRVMLKALIASACKGNSRATTLVIGLMARLLDADHAAALPLTTDDGEILAAFFDRAEYALGTLSEPEATTTAAPSGPANAKEQPT